MSEIARLYSGRFDDFVARRDALVKELRSAGDREGANRVKAIRKPSRSAWALSVSAGSNAFEQLVTAVNGTMSAQSRGRDVRAAMQELREAVRAFASHASETASGFGQNLDRNELVTAVFAVLGDPDAFARLTRGELSEIPEGGSLDILSSFTSAPVLTVSSTATESGSGKKSSRTKNGSAAGERKKAEDLARAEALLNELRKTSDQALRALNFAESELNKAEVRLDQAVKAADVARDVRDRARIKATEVSKSMSDAQDRIARLKA